MEKKLAINQYNLIDVLKKEIALLKAVIEAKVHPQEPKQGQHMNYTKVAAMDNSRGGSSTQ